MTCTISTYIASRKTLQKKIEAIDNLIEVFENAMLDYAAGQGSTVDEFQLDDGQMKVRTSYRSIKDVEAGISALERRRQRYINQYNGRVVVLRDARGI